MGRTTPLVGILMGSESDLPVMEEAAKVLEEYGIPHEVRICSAHRTPERAAGYAREAVGRGLKVLIAGAGGAAHLAGALAAQTVLPVIGIPLDATALHGLDSLLATVQMPAGVPVATVAVGKAGARNAALLALAILATADETLRGRLEAARRAMAEKVEAADRALQEKRRR